MKSTAKRIGTMVAVLALIDAPAGRAWAVFDATVASGSALPETAAVVLSGLAMAGLAIQGWLSRVRAEV